jgi:hypothetical protein
MASNNTIPPYAILNPYTPMAFLPPDVADQFQIMCYVYVAILAVSFNSHNINVRPQVVSYLVCFTGLHMGLAFVNVRRVCIVSKSGIQPVKYRVFFIEVSYIYTLRLSPVPQLSDPCD